MFGLLIWGLIPILIDLININMFSARLPKFWLLSEFTLISISLSFTVWVVYYIIVKKTKFTIN